jgi:uncharacterized protein
MLANMRSSTSATPSHRIERLSAARARRIALAAQGFADPRPTGRVDRRHLRRVLDRVCVLQLDSVNVLVRSHELPLFARLGPYPRPLLTTMVERDRELFEYWAHMASFVPVDLHPLLRWRMARAREAAWSWVAQLEREHPGFVEDVFSEVAERGPITAAQLIDGGARGGKWWGWAPGKTALEFLFFAGRITSAGRSSSFERRYDLPERVLPAPVLAAPTPTPEDAHRALLLRAARSMGVGTARSLADYFRLSVPKSRPRLAELVDDGALLVAEVEGWSGPAYLHPEAKIPRRVDASALLSPFDSLVWERKRTERVFGMRYRIELYTPPPKRVHGYYVLPFLLGDRLVARVDLKADRKRGTLVVAAAHAEPDRAPAAVAGPLAEELRAMADWLEFDEVDVADNGDLARSLQRAVR